MSNSKTKNKDKSKKRTKKITLYVGTYGMVSFNESFEDSIEICQDALDQFGVKTDRRQLAEDVVTKIVLSVESIDHGRVCEWVEWEKFKNKL